MIADILKGVPLFAGLDEHELRSVVELASVREYVAGTTLFSTGDPSDSFFVVAQGRVKIVIPSPDGSDEKVVSLGHGKFFGEMGVIRGTPRMATAQVEEDAELVTILAEDFDKLMGVDERISEKVMGAYLARMRELEGAKDGDRRHDEIRVLAFTSVGSGAGASFLVANLAPKIRDLTQKTVLVVDLDFQGASQHMFLGYAKPVGGLGGAFASPQMTPSTLHGAARRMPFGIDFLGGPGSPDPEEISEDRVVELLREASNAYDYVLVDTSSSPTAAVNDAIFRAADSVHVVIAPDPVSLSRSETLLARLSGLGLESRLRVVLNKVRHGSGLDPEAIEAQLKRELNGRIEFADSLVLDSLVEGSPVVRRNPRASVSIQVTRLARQVLSLPTQGTSAGTGSWFSIWNLFG